MIAARPHLAVHAMDGLLTEDVPLNRIADAVGTKVIPFVVGIKDLRQLLVFAPGFQADVHAFFCGMILIPLGIQVGLAQQGNAAHHGAGVALCGRALVERIMRRCSFF